MTSFISIGAGHDENSFYKEIIDDAIEKADSMPYAERRAYEMNNGDDDEYTIEGKFGVILIVCRGGLAGDGRNMQQRKGT